MDRTRGGTLFWDSPLAIRALRRTAVLIFQASGRHNHPPIRSRNDPFGGKKSFLTLILGQTPRIDLDASDDLLDDAQNAMIETDNHSQAWYEATARAKCEEILAKAAETRREEAQRRIRAKAIEGECEIIGNYAANRYGLDKREAIEMVRKFKLLQYRLLEEAIKIKQGENGG